MGRVEVRVPEEGKIVEWKKRVGEKVSEGEVILVIEAAKGTKEIEAPATGVLKEVLKKEGEDAAENEVVAIIETE